MHKLMFSALIMLCCCFCHRPVINTAITYQGSFQPGNPKDIKEFEAFIDSLITSELKRENVPGAGFVFVKDGRIFLMKGYGLANIEQNKAFDPERTVFRIGSISKVFTADAVLQLADQNKINLNKDINSYLQEIKIPSTFSNPITASHLLSHTAGLDEIRPGTQSPDSTGVQPLNLFLKDKLVRLWEPGETVMYSTYGITVAGALVEQISGMKFENYLKQNIFKPLAMTRSNINVPGELRNDLAIGYELESGKNIPQKWEWYHTTPASSLNSTLVDMAHWMIAHLNKGEYDNHRLMSARMVENMLQKHAGPTSDIGGVAYGFFEEYFDRTRMLNHGGNVAGFSSQVVLLPEMNAGFFFIGQHENSKIRDNVQWAILERYYSSTQKPGVPVIRPDAISRNKLFEGQYKWNCYCHTCAYKMNYLIISAKPNADGSIQLAGRRWIESKKDFLFTRDDGKAKIFFKLDSNGKVIQLYAGQFWNFEKFN